MDFRQACRTILDDARSRGRKCPALLSCAAAYAAAGLNMHHPEEIMVQCLYIRSNLSAWRHPDAPEIRQLLDDIYHGVQQP